MTTLLYFSLATTEALSQDIKDPLYETGLHVSMIAKWINDKNIGNNYQLVSFVDFAPTVLDAANLKENFHLKVFRSLKKIIEAMFMQLRTDLMKLQIFVEA